MTTFESLGLAQPLCAALEEEGYTTPTPIQLQAIPPALKGNDLLGIAQTGTGKTAAFALPILHYLIGNPAPRRKLAPRVLVLAPTRELATQIADSFRAYARFIKLNVMTVFGGVPIPRQEKQLHSGVDVLVATPGRLLDLVDRRSLLLGDVEILVLDEADQMLDLGFIHALKRIAQILPRQRQSLFFSATMPAAIAELAGRYLTDPVRVAVAPVATTAERVQQFVTHVNQAEKQPLLTMTLKQPEFAKCLVFTRTKHGADRVVRHLQGAGIRSAAIHGNKSQPQRERALEQFKKGEIGVLVATDIAARGIDIDAVSHVINFELPNVPEQYVHRIGRTARAGLDGIALSFCAPDEKPFLKDIEKLTRMKIDPQPLPDNFQKEAARLPKPMPVADERDRSDDARRGEVGSHRNAGRRFGGRGEDGVARGGRHAAQGAGRPDRRAEGRSAESRDGERPYVGHRNGESRFGEARPVDGEARGVETRGVDARAPREAGTAERGSHSHPRAARADGGAPRGRSGGGGGGGGGYRGGGGGGNRQGGGRGRPGGGSRGPRAGAEG
ncbi:MAG: DEAD/DEAH box helicase [Sandaracinobacteroides sp.]